MEKYNGRILNVFDQIQRIKYKWIAQHRVEPKAVMLGPDEYASLEVEMLEIQRFPAGFHEDDQIMGMKLFITPVPGIHLAFGRDAKGVLLWETEQLRRAAMHPEPRTEEE